MKEPISLTPFFSIFKKKKTKEIHICQKNIDRFYNQEAIDQFEQYLKKKNLLIREYECLNHCKECKKMPYIEIDGETIFCKNVSELIKELEERE
jgi:uncharacterized protein YuzB (UPF0349 family)